MAAEGVFNRLGYSRKVAGTAFSEIGFPFSSWLPSQALGHYLEGLGLAVEVGDRANAAYCLEGVAGLIATGSESELAVRLFGASEAWLEALGPSATPTRRTAGSPSEL